MLGSSDRGTHSRTLRRIPEAFLPKIHLLRKTMLLKLRGNLFSPRLHDPMLGVSA